MMYSLHSPMRLFPNQASALAEAAGFVERAMTPTQQAREEDPDNEEPLGRIPRGEKVHAVEAFAEAHPDIRKAHACQRNQTLVGAVT